MVQRMSEQEIRRHLSVYEGQTRACVQEDRELGEDQYMMEEG